MKSRSLPDLRGLELENEPLIMQERDELENEPLLMSGRDVLGDILEEMQNFRITDIVGLLTIIVLILATGSGITIPIVAIVISLIRLCLHDPDSARQVARGLFRLYLRLQEADLQDPFE